MESKLRLKNMKLCVVPPPPSGRCGSEYQFVFYSNYKNESKYIALRPKYGYFSYYENLYLYYFDIKAELENTNHNPRYPKFWDILGYFIPNNQFEIKGSMTGNVFIDPINSTLIENIDLFTAITLSLKQSKIVGRYYSYR